MVETTEINLSLGNEYLLPFTSLKTPVIPLPKFYKNILVVKRRHFDIAVIFALTYLLPCCYFVHDSLPDHKHCRQSDVPLS